MLRPVGPCLGLALLCGALAAGPAQAQTAANATTARGLLDALIISHLAQGESDVPFNVRKETLAKAIGNALSIGIATAPVGGASAGFALLVDPATGTSSLKSDSFGPLFLDRPLTSGRRAFTLGFTYSRTSFDRFQGQDLRDTGLLFFDNRVLYTQDNYLQFEKEYITLKPDASVFTVYGSYGITDQVDVGVIVPIANVSLKGRRYLDYDSGKVWPLSPQAQAALPAGPRATGYTLDEGDVSASGIGDITVRGVVALGAQRGQGAAVIGAVRLPTGSEEDFLGTGEASVLVKVVGSKAMSERASVYGNGGYAFGGLSDEVAYGAGVDVVLLPRKSLTVSFELLGQNIRDSVNGTASDTIGPRDQVDAFFSPPLPVRYSVDRLYFPAGSVNMVRGAVGAKYLLGGGAIVSGGVLFPVTDTGLRASTTAFVGLDINVGKR